MNESLILISTSAAVFLAVLSVVSLGTDLLFQDDARIEERLQREFQSSEKQNQQKSPLFRDLKMLQSQAQGSSIVREWWAEFSLHLEQTGISWPPQRIIAIAGAAGFSLAGIGYTIFAQPLVAGVLLFIGFVIPFAVVEFLWHRRRKILCEQLPDAFDQIRRSIRAGLPLVKAMQQIAADFPPPISDEFEICCQKQELGLSHGIAMQELARRINIMELQMFVVTVLIQRDIGGNTAEILGKLSNVVRQRFRLAARIKALTAEGRMQALVLAALPLLAGAFMTSVNPEYMRILLERPNWLIGLIVSELVGVLWIRRITSINF